MYFGGGSGIGLGVLIVWLVGYLGVAMPSEVAAVVGSLTVGAGAAIGSYGVKGCMRRLWNGRPELLRGTAD